MQIGPFLLALAALWTIQKPDQVESAGASERVFDLDRQLRQLDRSCQDGHRRLFYGPQVVAEQEKNYPLVELAIEMAESDAILYAHQRSGLLAARKVVNKYFVTRRAPLSPVLVPNNDLVDMTIMRSTAQSIESGFHAIEYRRKKIYLIGKMHENHPKVSALIRIYARRALKAKLKETKARKKFDELLDRYKEDVPFLWSASDTSRTLSAIDDLLREAADEDLDEDALLKRYVKSEVLVDLLVARHKSTGQFEPLLPKEVRSVSMKDVDLYDVKVMNESGVLGSYLDDLDSKVELMDQKFDQIIQEMFYEQQHMGVIKGNFPMLALAYYMAECESLMYAEERQMLTVLRDLVEEHEPEIFVKLSEMDKNLIYLVEHRLLMFAIESIIARSAERKKKLYLMLIQHHSKDGAKELAREHIKHINGRKSQLGEIQMSLLLYLQNIWAELPERKELVDKMVEKGITLWSANKDPTELLQMNLDPDLFRDLLGTRQRALKIFQPDDALIATVTQEDIVRYESELNGIPINASD